MGAKSKTPMILSSLAVALSLAALGVALLRPPPVAVSLEHHAVVRALQAQRETLEEQMALLDTKMTNSVTTILSLEVENLAAEVMLNMTGTGAILDVMNYYPNSTCTPQGAFDLCYVEWDRQAIDTTIVWNAAEPYKIRMPKNKTYTIGGVCEMMESSPVIILSQHRDGDVPCVDYPSQVIPLSPTGETYLGKYYYTEREVVLAPDEYLVLCVITDVLNPFLKHCEISINEFCTASRCVPDTIEALQTARSNELVRKVRRTL